MSYDSQIPPNALYQRTLCPYTTSWQPSYKGGFDVSNAFSDSYFTDGVKILGRGLKTIGKSMKRSLGRRKPKPSGPMKEKEKR